MKVFLGGVIWRDETHPFSESMRMLWMELYKRGIEFSDGTLMGDALVSRSRSIVASAFLRSDCDVLLTIDSDIWFRPEDAISLCEKAMEYKMIGGMYLTRALHTQPALLLPDDPVDFAPDSEPVPIHFISTGFMAVHREVFEAVQPTLPECHKGWNDKGVSTSFWPFYMPFCLPWPGDGHMYLSEDWAFCERAREAGFKIYLDPTIRLGHMSTEMKTLEDLSRPPRPAPQPMRLHRDPDGVLKTYLFRQDIHPVIRSLQAHVKDYFKKPLSFPSAYMQGTMQLAELWENRTESELEWYKRDDVGEAYIFDLAGWHQREHLAMAMTDLLSDIKGQRVLDYGSGIGTWALMLAAEKNVVECIEPNEKLREFTAYRAMRMDTPVKWRKSLAEAGQYDLIICWHVLEHVENPEEIVHDIIEHLAPGGRVITESDFTADEEHPMHHERHDDGESLWAAAGLIRETSYLWKKGVANPVNGHKKSRKKVLV